MVTSAGILMNRARRACCRKAEICAVPAAYCTTYRSSGGRKHQQDLGAIGGCVPAMCFAMLTVRFTFRSTRGARLSTDADSMQGKSSSCHVSLTRPATSHNDNVVLGFVLLVDASVNLLSSDYCTAAARCKLHLHYYNTLIINNIDGKSDGSQHNSQTFN